MKIICKILIINILSLIINTSFINAQRLITLDDALKLSQENYPKLKASRMSVEQQKILKSTAFDFGNTTFSMGKDEVKNGNAAMVVNFAVSQSDIDIFSMASNSKLKKAQVKLSEAEFNVVKKQINLEVGKAYSNLVFYTKTLVVYRQIDSIYYNFVKVAQLRSKTGESSRLEYLNAQAKYRELQVQIKQVISEKNAAKYKLNQFLLIDDDFEIDTETTFKLQIDGTTELSADNNVDMAFFNQKINVANKQWKQQRAQWLPKLNLSYQNQTAGGESGFYAYEVGLSFSLFNGQLSRTKSTRLQCEIEKENLHTAKLELETLLHQLTSKYSTLLDLQDYYKEKALPVAEEQIKTSTLAYKLGEIDYVNYIQNIESALNIKMNYLSTDLEFRNVQSEIVYLLK